MINYAAVKQAILNEITSEFFSRVMLSYSIPTKKLYNILHFVEFDVDPNYFDDDELYDRKYNMERSNRRINRIAVRLKENRKPGDGAEKDYAGAIYEPKYYDSIMFQGMVQAYNRICQFLGRPKIKVVTSQYMHRADVEITEELCHYNDHLVKCGYCIDIRNTERKSITLPEAIFYTAIYMSSSARALWTLNRNLINSSDYNRALRWHDKFMEEFKKCTVYEAVVWELFDMLYEKVASDYEELCGYCIQKFWLDEKYRDRKDRTRVLEKLKGIIYEGKVSRVHLDKQLKEHPERGEVFIDTSNRISILGILIYDVLPCAEMVALGRLSKLSKKERMLAEEALKKSQETYSADRPEERSAEKYEKAAFDYEVLQFREIAEALADIVCKIVDESYGVAKIMLHSLPESIAWISTE